MNKRKLLLLGCLLAAAQLGCDSSTHEPGAGLDSAIGTDAAVNSDAAQPAVATWNGGVGALLAENCGTCHQDGGSGPFVADFESSVVWSAAIRSAVVERRMPPMPVNNDGSCQTFSNARWLSDQEIALVVDWVDAGSPLGAPEQDYAFPPITELADPDVTLVTDSYVPNGERNDDYRCFVVDPGNETDVFITGYQVVAGNPQINHHMILYDITDPQWAIDKDAESETPGYECFGSAGPGSIPLALWAPGSGYNEFPAGTGIRLRANKKIVVQMHYNVKGGVMADEGTQVKLALAEQVERAAQYLPMVDMGMRLAPQQEYVTTENTFSLPSPGIRVYGSFPHMHTMGRTLRVDIASGGENRCMVDVDRWDFAWQEGWWYEEPLEFPAPKSLAITINCGYNTMGRNDVITWGDGTEDEMCLNYFYVSAL